LVLLSSHNNPNYFHWATQPGLAPLFLQEHFGLPPLQDAAIALSHRRSRPLPTYVEPLLELLAPDLPRHVAPALASASTCRLALQAHASSVVVSPRQLHWWRQRLKHVLSPVPRPWRRLLLSRRQARNRRCCNEDQLLAALTPLGFERVDLEQRSVQDQWQLFAEAAIVMGVHGAGFTNLVACQPGALVVELVPDQGPYSHYYLMASALGLRHGHLIGKPLDPTSTNFLVDPARLFELLGVLGVGDPA
jgi:capsular polysaccharide biosynthesis protein